MFLESRFLKISPAAQALKTGRAKSTLYKIKEQQHHTQKMQFEYNCTEFSSSEKY